MIRSAAAVPRALSGNPPRPLLSRPDLIDENCKAGGMVLIGSHVQKTTAQLEGLKASSALLEWIEFNQHLALEPGGLSREAERSPSWRKRPSGLERPRWSIPGGNVWIWTPRIRTVSF